MEAFHFSVTAVPATLALSPVGVVTTPSPPGVPVADELADGEALLLADALAEAEAEAEADAPVLADGLAEPEPPGPVRVRSSA